MRNLQEQVKKAFCYQKLLWPFTVWINCSSDLKYLANSQPSASNFKSFSGSLEQFFLTVGQNNFGNKIPLNGLKMYGFKNDCNVSICYVLNIDVVCIIIITIPFFFADWLPEAISQSSVIDAKTWFGHRNN